MVFMYVVQTNGKPVSIRLVIRVKYPGRRRRGGAGITILLAELLQSGRSPTMDPDWTEKINA